MQLGGSELAEIFDTLLFLSAKATGHVILADEVMHQLVSYCPVLAT
jgi:hypothetical protein